MNPADLGVVEAARLLAARALSSRELVQACLARIGERDGMHSFDGDAASVNAWVRVYDDDALAAAAATAPPDERAPLRGIPIGLKDLYGVAGHPVTASSRILHEVPARDCDVWARLRAAGMVLLGHLHTHEFAAGGTTDQVGNPWALARSAGGSSGGSAAALAARMVPAATGTDTAGSLRIPSAFCGTSTIKPTRGLLPTRGIVPLAFSLDHAGPMARSIDDCAALLAALVPRQATEASLAGARIALSPRVAIVALDADTAAGLHATLATLRRLGAKLVAPPPPTAPLDVFDDYGLVLHAEIAAYHRRFAAQREHYRPALREWTERAAAQAASAEDYAAAQARRLDVIAAWDDWFRAERIDALLEPTVPSVAWPRGAGYEHAGSDLALIALTHYWNWAETPVVALPAGVGAQSGLPVGVSLIARRGGDWSLLALASQLQRELGVPELAWRA
ncbi:MAG: amidase [Ideonella sp.]|nr:amidase [Ideonella sp.]MCC7457645.1 amidase [Nitrospira sp.]